MDNQFYKAVITGVGLLSALGETPADHLSIFSNISPAGLDTTSFSPYMVHQLPDDIMWSKYIQQKRYMRQMSIWQKIGVYTAGIALADAGVLSNKNLLDNTDLFVAAGGGERDVEADSKILEACRSVNIITEKQALLNKLLINELRPTLFLGQLANLLAGNIAMNYKLSSGSYTFMGEDNSGAVAIKQAINAVKSGHSKIALVGASYNANSEDALLNYSVGGVLEDKSWRPIKDRICSDKSLILGSGSAFLIIEEQEHAIARNAQIYSTIGDMFLDMLDRKADNFYTNINKLFIDNGIKQSDLIVSANSGYLNAANIEVKLLSGLNYVMPTEATGFLKEAQFPFATAIAALKASVDNINVSVSMVGMDSAEALLNLHGAHDGY